MCVHVDTGASQESHNPPEWLICALWNIVEYQAYFMIQLSAGSLFFSQRLGLFVKLSQSWPSGPPPSPLSRTFKHFRHVADAFIHGAACRSGQFGWGTNLRVMIDTVFYRLHMWGDMHVYVWTLVLWPWQTGPPHAVMCFDCRGKQGYSRAWCPR